MDEGKSNETRIKSSSQLLSIPEMENIVKDACTKILKVVNTREAKLEQQLVNMKTDLESITREANRHAFNLLSKTEIIESLRRKNRDMDEQILRHSWTSKVQILKIKKLESTIQERDATIQEYKNNLDFTTKNKLELGPTPSSPKDKLIGYFTKHFKPRLNVNPHDQQSSSRGLESKEKELDTDVFENFKVFLDSNDSSMQCSICQEVFVYSTVISCGHIFCEECIDRWRMSSATCPICRKKIRYQTSITDLDNHLDKCVDNFMPKKYGEERSQLIADRKSKRDNRVDSTQNNSINETRQLSNFGSITSSLVASIQIDSSNSDEDEFGSDRESDSSEDDSDTETRAHGSDTDTDSD